MAVGARDQIDRELVRKYAKLKMDNPETTKLLDGNIVLDVMNDISNLRRDMIAMDKKLSEICSAATSKSAKYMRINFVPPRRRQPC